ncbi:MAG: maleate cis-trans isomerase family protein [Arenicella sp.]
MNNFNKVGISPVFDNGPGKQRIGLVVLSTDYATERDFRNMLPTDDIAFFVSRIETSGSVNVDDLSAHKSRLAGAAELILPGGDLDVMAFSCTSATAVIGQSGVEKAIHAARPGIPCVTPISAALAAFDALEVNRIAVLTPYIDEVNKVTAACLTEAGVNIVAFNGFQIEDDHEMAKLSPQSIAAAAREVDTPEAEAIFISCTALRSADVVEELEQALGKPVITSIQAMFWQCLRKLNYKKPIDQYGQLFRLV